MRFTHILLCSLLMVSLSAFAQQQSPVIQGQLIKHASGNQNERLGIGESITITPNPVLLTHPLIHISAVNVEIYSYIILTAYGEIVELENLSGRPDLDIIDLTGEVASGTFIIRFDTDSGPISRKFVVI